MNRLVLAALVTLTAAACTSQPPAQPTPEPEPATSATRTARPLGPAQAPPDAEDIDPAPDVLHVQLTASAFEDASGQRVYGYNGLRPGPTLRAKPGDRVEVDLINALDVPTTIHWHGLKVPFEMDGVVWRGAPVAPGASMRYSFTVDQPGTFWYHPHFDTEAQVDRGLYGAFIVTDPAHPAPDAELILVLDAPDEHTDAGPNPVHGHGARVRQWWVNGHVRPSVPLPGGSRAVLRLINASNTGYLDLSTDPAPLRQIGSDQGLLAAPHSGRVVLGPGDRADLEVALGPDLLTLWTTPYSLNGGPSLGEPVALLDLQPSPAAAAPAAPLDLPFSGLAPTPDPGSTDIVYVFTGSDRTGRWLINGERFPDVTIETIPFGATRIVEVRNLSPSEHPFHLHGLVFEVLSINGTPPDARLLEDTLNLAVRDVVRLRVVADNPGDWMTHCHILPHADDGMMTVLRVSEPEP